jgi:hypothetical protein
MTTPKQRLDDFHTHEVLDRLNLIASNIDDFLLCHPYVEANPLIHDNIDTALGILAKTYQMVGQSHLSPATPPANEWVEVAQLKWDGDKVVAKLKEHT